MPQTVVIHQDGGMAHAAFVLGVIAFAFALVGASVRLTAWLLVRGTPLVVRLVVAGTRALHAAAAGRLTKEAAAAASRRAGARAVLSGRDDPRAIAEAVFRDRLGPVLALAERHPDATDVFIDGDAIRVSLGDERLLFGYADFPGLTPRAVEAAGAAAAVFAGVEFGPSPPARPLISVKIPPDLRVTFVRPPAADGWHVDVRFLRTRALTLEDYVRQGVMTRDQAAEVRRPARGPQDDRSSRAGPGPARRRCSGRCWRRSPTASGW